MYDFNKMNNIGKKSELEVYERLVKEYGEDNVKLVADEHRPGDILLYGNIRIEVKNQRCLRYNRIIIELNYRNARNEIKLGWYYKDNEVTAYCFHLDGTTNYFFISRDKLHYYIENLENKDLHFSKDGNLLYVDIYDIIRFFNDTNIVYRNNNDIILM